MPAHKNAVRIKHRFAIEYIYGSGEHTLNLAVVEGADAESGADEAMAKAERHYNEGIDEQRTADDKIIAVRVHRLSYFNTFDGKWR